MARKTATLPLRADAERNRDLIVDAARRAFAERGLDVAIEEVARRAGVGVGTVYRRFPTRADLIAGAFESKLSVYADAVEEALGMSDAWAGFSHYVERVCEMQAEDVGFASVLTMIFPVAKRFEAIRKRAYAGFVELVRRAKATGELREDFVPEDLPMLLMANAGVLAVTGATAPRTSARLVAYLLQSFAASGSKRGPLPAPPTSREIFRAMLRVDPFQSRGDR
jgi:AcrR family transcriptional regulator